MGTILAVNADPEQNPTHQNPSPEARASALELKQETTAVDAEAVLQEQQLGQKELDHKEKELALARRQANYRFIEIVFGTLVLGTVGLMFRFADFRRQGQTDEIKFLEDHLTTFEEKNPHVRKEKIAQLIAIRNDTRSFLAEQLKQAQTDAAAAESAEIERKRLEEETKLAKNAEEKKQAEMRLAAATAKAEADKKAQEERLKAVREFVRDGRR